MTSYGSPFEESYAKFDISNLTNMIYLTIQKSTNNDAIMKSNSKSILIDSYIFQVWCFRGNPSMCTLTLFNLSDGAFVNTYVVNFNSSNLESKDT